jgi:hypothetical protein
MKLHDGEHMHAIKPVIVTDEREIASILNNDLDDIIGGYKEGTGLDGYWYADRDSLNEWRERQRQLATDGDSYK